jgi:hypothetical protein
MDYSKKFRTREVIIHAGVLFTRIAICMLIGRNNARADGARHAGKTYVSAA